MAEYHRNRCPTIRLNIYSYSADFSKDHKPYEFGEEYDPSVKEMYETFEMLLGSVYGDEAVEKCMKKRVGR